MSNPIAAVAASLALAVVVLAAGCASSVNTIENRDKAAVVQPVTDARIITDDYFDRRVAIVNVIEDRGAAGNRIVEVEAVNTSNAYQRFRYQFTWFNPAGREVTSLNTTWVDESIAPGGRERLSSVAPNASAEDFRLEILRYDP
ncbi:MAG: YcfL family protein [Planctomycetota bacterium]